MTRFGLLVGMCLLIGGCASTGAVPRPFPVPGGGNTGPPTGTPTGATDPLDPPAAGFPSRPRAAIAGTDGYSISSTALSFRGTQYRSGGADPAGFDCSGLVQYVFGQHGVALPRDARRQFEVGQAIDTAALEPGDLVFFTTVAPGASHVGIVVGGDQFVHAPGDNGAVRVDQLSAQYWSNRFVGAKRIN
jgi:cell wall-associated NlpC family hydrolase